MSKLFLPYFTFALFLISISFKSDNAETIIADPPDAAITAIACAPSFNNIIKGIPFSTEHNTQLPVMIRKNIYTLSDSEINFIRTGVAAMKALPLSNPTSWGYQAAIHGTYSTVHRQSWNTCEHGTQFFFSWHRMYLYFFERILRAKSGNPNLTLPYWDYQTNGVLHPAYRTKFIGSNINPLYDSTRKSTINNGGSLPLSISTAFNNALLDIPFYTYQTDINGPHGSVHTSIGGDMVYIKRSAKDPVFFLHHANIDRLWEVWLRKCGGRINPDSSDSTWWNKSYTFFDENGAAIVMTANQIVSTAAQLNYQYDFPDTVTCSTARIGNEAKLKWESWNLITLPNAVRLNQKISSISLSNANHSSLDAFLKTNNNNPSNAKHSSPDQLYLEIDIKKINQVPEGVIEVYLNLPPNETPTAKSKSFVSVLDLFTPFEHSHPNGESHNINKLNATYAAQALGLHPSDLANARLTFVTRGNTLPDSTEVLTESDIQIGNLNFKLNKRK